MEQNFFDRCDGELEIISSKSCDNIYRGNTFLNCAGMLTLRHGNRYVPFAYDATADFTVLSFRTTNVLRWEFKPGSTMFVVWQQGREDSTTRGAYHFGKDFGDLFATPSTNTLLVKLAYWLNYAATNLQFHSGKKWQDLVSHVGNRMIGQSEEGGALPTLYAATADVPPNSFAGPSGFMEQRGPAKLVGRSSAAQDMDVARRLWDVSEELTETRFPLGATVG